MTLIFVYTNLASKYQVKMYISRWFGGRMSLDQKVLVIQFKKGNKRGDLAFKVQTSKEGRETKK